MLKLPCDFLEHSELIVSDHSVHCQRNKKWKTSLSLSSSVLNIVVLTEKKLSASLMFLMQSSREFLVKVGQNPLVFLSVLQANDNKASMDKCRDTVFIQLSSLIRRNVANGIEFICIEKNMADVPNWKPALLARFSNSRLLGINQKLSKIHSEWTKSQQNQNSPLFSNNHLIESVSMLVEKWKKQFLTNFKVIEGKLGEIQIICYQKASANWNKYVEDNLRSEYDCELIQSGDISSFASFCCAPLLDSLPALVSLSGIRYEYTEELQQLCSKYFVEDRRKGVNFAQLLVTYRGIQLRNEEERIDIEKSINRAIFNHVKSIEFKSVKQFQADLHDTLYDCSVIAMNDFRDSICSVIVGIIQQFTAIEKDITSHLLGKEKSAPEKSLLNLQHIKCEPLTASTMVFSELQRFSNESIVSNARKIFGKEEIKSLLCGNQFVTLAHQIYRSEDLSPLCRILISSEIANHLQLYQTMYKDLYGHTKKGSIHSYLYDLSQPNTVIGDQITLQAAANCYHAEILLLNEDKIVRIAPFHNTVTMQCVMAYMGGGSYWSLYVEAKEEPQDLRLSMKKNRVSSKLKPDAILMKNESLKERCIRRFLIDGIDVDDEDPESRVALFDDISGPIIQSMKLNCLINAKTLSFFCNSVISHLDLSSSHQVDDNVLKVICQGHGHHLLTLNLKDCAKITGNGVAEISSCIHLEELNLEGCMRVNNFGLNHIFRYCKNLQRLNLNYCTEITELNIVYETLQYLSVIGLSALKFSSLKHLRNLQTVDLSQVRHFDNGNLSKMVQQCPSLSCITLSNNHVDNEAMSVLFRSLKQTLSSLSLYCLTAIDNDGLSEIPDTLQALTIINCPKVTKIYKPLKRLRKLEVDSCRALDFLRNNESLEVLVVQNAQFFDYHVFFEVLNSLVSNLDQLTFSKTEVNEDCLAYLLRNAANMTKLVLENTSIQNACFMDGLPMNLKHLNLARCPRLTGKVFENFTDLLNLQELVLGSNEFVDDACIDLVCNSFPLLTLIDVKHNTKITGQAVFSIFTKLRLLEVAILSFCVNLSLSNVLSLKMQSTLNELRIAGIKMDKCNVVKSFSLRTLSISWTELSDDVLLEIVQSYPRLSNLDIRYCLSISSECIKNCCLLNKNLYRLQLNGIKSVDALVARYLVTVEQKLIYI